MVSKAAQIPVEAFHGSVLYDSYEVLKKSFRIAVEVFVRSRSGVRGSLVWEGHVENLVTI